MLEQIAGPTSHIYFSQRLRLHYVDWGNAAAPPLLMVHGGRDHCRNWDWVAHELRRDYHLIAPDLRGHGDSQWMLGGSYNLPEFVCDIAQLLHQTQQTPTVILAHSLGGMISLLYAGLNPENVAKLVVIEGLGLAPKRLKEQAAKSTVERYEAWVEELRELSGRVARRYPTLEEAWARMQEANPHLSPEQARHLTVHGVNRNEDGTYSWKFDNYLRATPPYGISPERTQELWGRIACPVLLLRGTESWASDPVEDGRIRFFRDARRVNVEGAGHWLHHDRLQVFLKVVREFLAE
jgi:pimeloyl-ACP methyl ester carboxylesterase